MPRKKAQSGKPRAKRSLQNSASTENKLPGYEELVEHLDEMIVVINRNYRFVVANAAYLRYRKTGKARILGRRVSDMAGKEVFERVLKPRLDECFTGQVVKFEMKFQYPHLGERDLHVSYFPVNGPNRVERVACVFQDITERKRADTAIRMERDRAQQYLDIADVILVALDLHGRITLINRKGCSTLGWAERELLGRKWVDICVPASTRHEFGPRLQSALAGDLSYVEVPILTKMGGQRTIGWHHIQLRDSDGRVTGILRSGEDITDRKLAEAALRQMSGRLLQVQDDERRKLARELHDGIGTYISGLSLALGQVRNFLNDADPEHQRVLNECSELIRTASGEIRAISYLLHPPTLEELGLGAALEWLVRGFSSRSGISISLKMGTKLGRFTPEIELTLFRVTQEALNNVYRHSGSSDATVRLFLESGSVVLEIADRGRGMQPSELASNPSLAVGILGMRERLQDLGGAFSIESVPGDGCVVRATIPIARGAQAG